MTIHEVDRYSISAPYVTDKCGGMEVTAPCTCGNIRCFHTFWISADFLWESHKPVKPDDRFLLCSKITAIKELRSVSNLSLIGGKNMIDSCDVSDYVFSADTPNGFTVRAVFTYLPDNDDNHKFSVSIRYS
jgi:hypothetical protein